MNVRIKQNSSTGKRIFKFYYFFWVSFAFEWFGWFCLFNGLEQQSLISVARLGCISLARLGCNCISDKQKLLFQGFCNNCKPLSKTCGKCDTSKRMRNTLTSKLMFKSFYYFLNFATIADYAGSVIVLKTVLTN